jgi:hypothetical protein
VRRLSSDVMLGLLVYVHVACGPAPESPRILRSSDSRINSEAGVLAGSGTSSVARVPSNEWSTRFRWSGAPEAYFSTYDGPALVAAEELLCESPLEAQPSTGNSDLAEGVGAEHMLELRLSPVPNCVNACRSGKEVNPTLAVTVRNVGDRPFWVHAPRDVTLWLHAVRRDDDEPLCTAGFAESNLGAAYYVESLIPLNSRRRFGNTSQRGAA